MHLYVLEAHRLSISPIGWHVHADKPAKDDDGSSADDGRMA